MTVEITQDNLTREFWRYVHNDKFEAALERYFALLEGKNQKYGDAWQVDGLLTSLVDLKDKLYRISVLYDEQGQLAQQNVYLGKDLEDKIFDTFARSLMLLMKMEEMQQVTINPDP